KLLVGSTEVGASEEYPLPPAFGGRGLVLTVLHVCQQATTSDRGCFFDQSPRSSKLRNTCVVFGALVSHSPLKISLGLSGGLCQLLLDQLDLSVSFALNFLDSLDQQVSSVFGPLAGSIDFDLKLGLGFTKGLFILGFESFDLGLVSSNLTLDLKIHKLASGSPEDHATQGIHASIERCNPCFIDFGHNGPSIWNQVDIHFGQEVVADSNTQQIKQRTAKRAGNGADSHTDRATQQTNQTSGGKPGESPERTFICRLLHCDHTICVLEDHRSSVKRQAALLMKFAQRSGAFIRASFIVENCHNHLVHSFFSFTKNLAPVALRRPTKHASRRRGVHQSGESTDNQVDSYQRADGPQRAAGPGICDQCSEN